MGLFCIDEYCVLGNNCVKHIRSFVDDIHRNTVPRRLALPLRHGRVGIHNLTGQYKVTLKNREVQCSGMCFVSQTDATRHRLRIVEFFMFVKNTPNLIIFNTYFQKCKWDNSASEVTGFLSDDWNLIPAGKKNFSYPDHGHRPAEPPLRIILETLR